MARRSATDGAAWDRLVPGFVLPYAVWTIYVHFIVATQAGFTSLLRGLPVVVLVAAAATAGWFGLRSPAGATATPVPTGSGAAPAAAPLAVLVLAMSWVGLLAAGMPYPVFWWGSLLALFAAWLRHLRGTPPVAPDATASGHAAWIVACVVAAAVCVVLVANRPDADDAFHLSIPATLLRFPDRPVLLHDTLYRLQDTPILLPFYRLGNYDVLIAVVARATGIDHLVVAYLVLPPLFAALTICAWVYLLRRIVPARWPLVLPILFVCVVALGEVHRAYGNFAFVRLFQGKAILASCIVPAIAAAALLYARHGGLRHWLLLLATQVAALGFAASAMFVAPAAAALGLAGGWSASAGSSRRFATGLLASAYVLGAAALVATGARGEHVLSIASPRPMPGVAEILGHTWGPWSTRVLLVTLLAAWAFVRDPVRARYFSAGAFCFVLVALNPYTTPFVAHHFIGAQTYWRLTWALPLPLFLAVMLDGVIARALAVRPKALATTACLALLAAAIAFGWRAGSLLCANSVTLGPPGLNVPPAEFKVARTLVEQVPDTGVVLAPEAVASWIPIFVVHPDLIGARHMYLSLAFPPDETARRSNMMRYVEGRYRPDDADAWFQASLRDHGVTAVVFARSIPWAGDIEGALTERGWTSLSSGQYRIFVAPGSGSASIPIRP